MISIFGMDNIVYFIMIVMVLVIMKLSMLSRHTLKQIDLLKKQLAELQNNL